jgi:hypothetical protein
MYSVKSWPVPLFGEIAKIYHLQHRLFTFRGSKFLSAWAGEKSYKTCIRDSSPTGNLEPMSLSVESFFFGGGGSATPCASPAPWPSIFSDYSFWVYHPVNRDDQHPRILKVRFGRVGFVDKNLPWFELPHLNSM